MIFCFKARCWCALATLVAFASSGATDAWIDTDVAIGSPVREVDDAYALLLAFRSSELKVLGVSSTFGNASIAVTTKAAAAVVSRFNPAPPGQRRIVWQGARSPLDIEAETPASLALERQLRSGGRITYLALGPLTNLATVLRLHPELAGRIGRVVFVGGRSPQARLAFGPGNILQIHDANVFKDPAAARTVLASEIPLTLVPIETASHLMISRADLRTLRGSTAAGAYLAANSTVWNWFWTAVLREPGGPVFDAAAVLALARSSSLYEDTRFAEMTPNGELIVEERLTSGGRKVTWCSGLTASAKPLLMKRLTAGRPKLR